MKHLLIFLVMAGFAGAIHAQVPAHTVCDSAKKMCDLKDQYFNLNGSEEYCTQPLYYSFHLETMSNSQLIFQSLGSGGAATLYHVSTDSFNTGVCEQVQLGTATITGSISFDPYQTDTLFFNLAGMYILQVVHDSCYIDPNNVPVIGFNTWLQTMEGITCPDFVPGEPEPELGCTDCISSFSPASGKYRVSAWVNEEGASMNTVSYTNASIEISFSSDPATFSLVPSGRIIDGWQQVQGVIEVPQAATDIHIALKSAGVDSYFDDIRFYPLDGSMVSYVYDPVNLRLMAQLDERNYATFYEYDEEGKLIRVKKETERGVMTIQENRDNIKKQ